MQMSKKTSDYYRCRQDWAPRQLTDHPLPEWHQVDMTWPGCLETQQNYKDCSLIFFRRHDIQHNDTQHNDTQHKGLICETQHK